MSYDELFDKEDLYNRFIVTKGFKYQGSSKISLYVCVVKLKKIFKAASDEQMKLVNEIKFKSKTPFKNFAVTRENLIRMLEAISDELILKCLYVAQTDGVMDAMLCLMNLKKYDVDLKFLNSYFLTPPELPSTSLDDVP